MFSRLKASNFLSWANLDFSFEQGITLLEGFNHDEGMSEGSGKSAIPNALCWILFGKLPKDALADAIIKEGEKTCNGSVELEDGSRVCRSRKPNDVWIEHGGATIKGKDARETQVMIDELIGLSFETFCQSVYFAQNYPNKFVTANEEQKSKILSEILNIKVFDDARKLVTEDLRIATLALANIQRDVRAKDILLTSQREGIEALQEEVNRFDAEKEQQIGRIDYGLSQLHAQLSEEQYLRDEEDAKRQDDGVFNLWANGEEERLNAEADELSEQLGGYKQAAANRANLERDVNERKIAWNRANSALERAQNAEETPHCPTCKRAFDADPAAREALLSELNEKAVEAHQKLQQAKTELAQAVVPDVSEVRAKQADVTAQRQHVQAERQAFTKLKATIAAFQRKVDSTKTQIDSAMKHRAQIENTSNESTRIKLLASKKVARKTDSELFVLKDQELEVGGQVINLESLKQAFREVKSYVFREVLAELSRKTNSYLEELFQIPVSVQFTNLGEGGEIAKIQVDATMDGIERPLGLYSGGQFRRLQLAIDLALSDIVASRGTKPLGLRIFDEACKDLSATSMETVVRLLERLRGTTIVVEHNELIKSAVSRVFKIERRDGTSTAA